MFKFDVLYVYPNNEQTKEVLNYYHLNTLSPFIITLFINELLDILEA